MFDQPEVYDNDVGSLNPINTKNDANSEAHQKVTDNIPENSQEVASILPTNLSIRRTSRKIKEPIWMKDYNTKIRKPSSTRHPLANYICYDIYLHVTRATGADFPMRKN